MCKSVGLHSLTHIMKLAHLLTAYQSDIAAVASHYNVNVATAPGGKTGLLTMYSLLDIARKNRAYDDSHPAFESGQWDRVLPYNGTHYCDEYYANGGNDTHVATLLRKIKENLS